VTYELSVVQPDIADHLKSQFTGHESKGFGLFKSEELAGNLKTKKGKKLGDLSD
jgi:hypothetical protein